VTEQLANDDEAVAPASRHAGERMTQVVQPHIVDLGVLADTPPRLFNIDHVPASSLAADHEGIPLEAWSGLQQRQG
jgi:hypothetical protein